MECKVCGFKEEENNKFVGIFSYGETIVTTNDELCGLYGCPNCNSIIYTTDFEYIKARKIEYKSNHNRRK